MKKVRIMLAAIVVLGSVGSALAFKAKTFGTKSYCTTSNLNSITCSKSVIQASFQLGHQFRYVITDDPTLCEEEHPLCTSVGIFVGGA